MPKIEDMIAGFAVFTPCYILHNTYQNISSEEQIYLYMLSYIYSLDLLCLENIQTVPYGKKKKKLGSEIWLADSREMLK